MTYKLLLLSFSFTFLLSCGTTKETAKGTHSQQLKYIPSQVHDTYLGMPLAEFKKVRENMTLEDAFEFRSSYVEVFNKGEIKEITYYFGAKGEMPLYEYIIDYHSAEKRDEFVAANLGNPNNEEEWVLDSKEGFKIKAWLFENKLVVAGVIKDTEWYEEGN